VSAAKSELGQLPLLGRGYEPEKEMDTPLIMGIDPGLSGAISVVEIDSGTLIDMIDMPTYKTPTKSRKSGHFEHVDPHQLSSLLDMYAGLTSLAVIEEPGAMPRQGLSSTFRFGHVCGLIHGILAGHYVPVIPVKPAVWKGAFGLSPDKDESIAMATDEYEGFQWLWTLKKHNDRAEAALLASYGLKYLRSLVDFNRNTP